MDTTTIEAADYAARHWTGDDKGPIQLGSEAHKRAFCRMFHDTFNPYKPSVIAWPKLDAEALQRLTSLPIWDIAVQTEGKARLRMASYAGTLADPETRAVIAQNAWEENRHKEVLSNTTVADWSTSCGGLCERVHCGACANRSIGTRTDVRSVG